jgi:hypothetical protein
MPLFEPSIKSISAGTTRATSQEVVFADSNGVSFGVSGNTITASVIANTGAFGGIAAGTQTATSGTVLFSNSNLISFGMSDSSVVTASYANPIAFGVSNIGNTAGNTGTLQETIVFVGAGNVTLTQLTAPGGQATIIINATLPVTSNNGVFIAGGTETATGGTVVFSNSNGVSFGLSNSTVMTASVDAIKSISAGTTMATNGQVVFSNSNNVSFGLDGNTLTASFNQTLQPVISGLGVSNLGNTLGNTGTTIGQIVFAGIGNITLSQSTDAGSFATITISGGAQSVAPAAIAAGTQTGSSGTILFADSNGISFGMSGSTQVTATADYVRSISAGTTNATGNQIILVNSNGVSFGADGNTITASVLPSLQPITIFSQWAEFDTNYTISAGVMSFQKVSLPMPISASYGLVVLDLLGHTNSFGGMTMNVAAYTLTGQTAQSIASGAGVYSWTSGSATSASSVYAGASGTRYRSFGWNVSMTPGDYLFAFVMSTTNDVTCRVFGRQGVNIVGSYAGAETNYFLDGYSNASVMAFPDVVIATDAGYARTGLSALQQPGFILIGTT